MDNKDERIAYTEKMIDEEIEKMTDKEVKACELRCKILCNEIERYKDWRYLTIDSVDMLDEEIKNSVDFRELELYKGDNPYPVDKRHPYRSEMDLRKAKLLEMIELSKVQSVLYNAIVNRYGSTQCSHYHDEFFETCEKEYLYFLRAFKKLLNKFSHVYQPSDLRIATTEDEKIIYEEIDNLNLTTEQKNMLKDLVTEYPFHSGTDNV